MWAAESIVTGFCSGKDLCDMTQPLVAETKLLIFAAN